MKKELTLDQRITCYRLEERRLLNGLKLDRYFVVHFPNKKRTPFLARLANWIIMLYGGKPGILLKQWEEKK